MSSTRRAESLNPRRVRRRLNSSPGHPREPSVRQLLLTDQDSPPQTGEAASTAVMAGPSRHTRSASSIPPRARRSEHLLGPVIPLDQIVSRDRAAPRNHPNPSLFSIFDDEGDVTDDSGDDTELYQPAIPPLQNHNAQPGSLWPNLRDRAASRAAQVARFSHFYESGRDYATSAEPKVFPDNPSIVLVYKLSTGGRAVLPGMQDTVNNSTASLRYLPLVPAPRNSISTNKPYMIQPSHQQRIDSSRLTARRAQWIPNEVPVELFDAITQYLSRDDIKSMRLVNKEFERGVSHSLFDTVVVPFNTELYDMIEQERGVKRDFKGKRRADDLVNNFVDLEPGSLQWKNAMDDKEDKVYRGHGIEVFEGFGGHIRRFGMSFEIREDALQNPPQKSALDHVESYFGSYDWPSREYTRFEKLAGLEATADETSQMKLAFSHLSKVQQLALSMDSGLGWMNGPDRSLRGHILQRPPQVFGCSHGIVDAQQQDRARLWETLETAHRRAGTLDELKEGQLERVDLKESLPQVRPLAETPYINSDLWASAPTNATAGALDENGDDSDVPLMGTLYVQTRNNETRERPTPASSQGEDEKADDLKKAGKQNFNPANLTKYQKEWLLEAEWAQRAFLTSYMLAVVDNTSVFKRVSVLNLARISSRLVPLFSRNDFWDALPKLKEVTLGVIPDWRTVERDDAGFVETKDIDPSHAVGKAYNLLRDFVGPRESIKKLKFSWAAGGEHAEGLFARNHHVLPAPITVLSRAMTVIQTDDCLISLPHVEELTLSNCWISPLALVNLVKNLEKASLKKITLDSVSLTANPRNTLANQNAGGAVGNAGGNGNLPAQFATQFGAQVWQGPPQGVAVNQWAQTMLQNLTWTMQQQGIVIQQLPNVWTGHPMGMTMQQLVNVLNALAAGGPNAQPGFLFQQQAQQPNQQQAQQQQPGPQFTLINPNTQMLMPGLPVPQNAANPPVPGPPPPPQTHANNNAQPPADQPWYEGHRQGSWIRVIDKLSPGPRLEWYRPRDEFEPEPNPRKTGVAAIEFISCGYVQLRSPHFDQSAIESPSAYRMSRYFNRRQSLLQPAMLATMDKYVGTVVQYMSEREQEALRFAWDMRMGWQDETLAEEAEYDGYLPGGTGRFSGILTRDTPVGAAAHS